MKHFAYITQIQISLGMAALGLGVALGACSSSSTGTNSGTDGGTTSGDSGSTKDSGGTSGGDAGGGCVAAGAAGNAIGVGKQCTTEAECVGNGQATLCAVIGGDPNQDFCTFQCKPADGGADPCGDNASCACDPSNPSQCGCTPLSCQ